MHPTPSQESPGDGAWHGQPVKAVLDQLSTHPERWPASAEVGRRLAEHGRKESLEPELSRAVRETEEKGDSDVVRPCSPPEGVPIIDGPTWAGLIVVKSGIHGQGAIVPTFAPAGAALGARPMGPCWRLNLITFGVAVHG